MYITSISLSYVFLGITVLTLLFSIYYKILVIKTSPDNKSRNKIIKDMKDPVTWREKNNLMAYISLFWAAVSLCLFVYLKFFYTAGLIYSPYLYIYLAVIAASIGFFSIRKKRASKID